MADKPKKAARKAHQKLKVKTKQHQAYTKVLASEQRAEELITTKTEKTH